MSAYHVDTAYHRESLGGYGLDWSNQPSPFKEYLYRPVLDLPRPRLRQAAFFELALPGPAPERPHPAELDAANLAAVLLLSGGITSPAPPGLRAVASAGALYPAELYVAACGVAGLKDGLYHFAPQGPGLHLLWGQPLAAAAGKILGREPAALSFFITAMFWRTLFKYRARAYRYCLLDAGHLLANLELALSASGLGPLSTADFPDSSAAVFLGLASEEEAALCAVQAGAVPRQPGPAEAGLPPLDRDARPLSNRVGRDTQVLAAHAEGKLDTPLPPRSWLAPPAGPLARRLEQPARQGQPLWEVVSRRRSRRNFLRASLDKDALALLLAAALAGPGPCRASVLLASADDFPGGVYDYLPGAHALLPRCPEEDRRGRMGRACLDQLWVGQAALILVLWAKLEELAEMHGPRAYRHAMLAAGRAGQRLYLAATALGLGCCGVGAFYDQEVAQAVNLPEGAHPLYVLACGPVKGGARPTAG